jgi:hypothetical protein
MSYGSKVFDIRARSTKPHYPPTNGQSLMPPIRSSPAAKPVKTERSHEENQERYVATLLTHGHVGANSRQIIHRRLSPQRPRPRSSCRTRALFGSAALPATYSSSTLVYPRNGSTTNSSEQKKHYRLPNQQQLTPIGQNQPETSAQSPKENHWCKGSLIDPLSTLLPIVSQQLLATHLFNSSSDDIMPSVDLHRKSHDKGTYSYKTNSRPKSKSPFPAS